MAVITSHHRKLLGKPQISSDFVGHVLLEPSNSTIMESSFVTGSWIDALRDGDICVLINGKALRLSDKGDGTVVARLVDGLSGMQFVQMENSPTGSICPKCATAETLTPPDHIPGSLRRRVW